VFWSTHQSGLILKLGSRGASAPLATLLTRHEVVVCGQVVADLLAGTPPSGRAELWMLMAGLPWIELRHDGWRRVGELEGDLLARLPHPSHRRGDRGDRR